jgi:hypothetical protein
MAHQQWTQADHPWKKAWYEPFDQIDQVALALRFTVHLPATAMIPPGHWELFQMAAMLAQSDALTPLNKDERELLAKIAAQSKPIFPQHA